MPPRFDEESCTLRLSVADLLEREVRGSLGFGNRGGFERLWLGQAIHSAYQNRALEEDPSYRSEVWVEVELSHRGWRVTLQGRVDGLRQEGDMVVVEEIKSVRRGGALAPAIRETYERQAAIYAWMLHEREEAEVRAELILIEIGSQELERLELDVNLDAVAAGVRRRLGSLIGEHRKSREARLARHEAAGRMTFPHPVLRTGQQAIVERVGSALEEREHLFVEAPTGLGKTAAVFFPVLRFAQLHDKKVYILTAKNLQQEMAGEVLGLLNREGSFRSLRLRAKAKMCANRELLCHEEYCPFARDYFLKLQSSRIVGRLLEAHPHLKPEPIFEQAEKDEVCPFEVSLELSREVHAVVGDYNYVFDPYVALTPFSRENDLSDTILVIDEAHNLVDRGRGYYSPEISAEEARATAGGLLRRGDERLAAIASLAEELARIVDSAAEDALPPDVEEAAAQIQLPETELWALRPDFEQAFVDYLEFQREMKSFRSEDPFVALYFDVVRFLDTAAAADERFSFLVKRRHGEGTLKILCRDASVFLGRIVNRTHSTIALSATLSPSEFYRELLGFDGQRSSSLSVPDPFPAAHRRIVVDTTVTTTWRRRQENYPRIASRLGDFVRQVPGNCLALFPSYAFLEEIASRLPELEHEVIVQRRSDDPGQREAMLDSLRGSLFGRVLLLSVAGGVFAEGVDYPGRMLQAVAVVGPCLPTVGLEQQLLQDHFDERYEKGFEYAYVIPGMTRVVQAAGRLIRSDDDRGVIALFDRRFLQEPYVRHLPDRWIPEEGAGALAAEPAAVAAEFFGESGLASEGRL